MACESRSHLNDEQIRKVFEGAAGQLLAAMASGSRRPVVLVDDLTPSTPVNRVLQTSWTFWSGVQGTPPSSSRWQPRARTQAGLDGKPGPLPANCRVVVKDFGGR